MMKKLLILDRDGTLIVEPPEDYQVDSLEKLEFLPGVFRYLSRIVDELDYELVMITNQDGLGTESYPEDTFWPAHNKMMQAFANEGIRFRSVHIDRTFKHENAPTRKPGTGLMTEYLSGSYDLAHSIVVGDRPSDILLAYNLEARGIMLGKSTDLQDDDVNPEHFQQALLCEVDDWQGIYQCLKARQGRSARILRQTAETIIEASLQLDGSGQHDIQTGIGFFDHMLHQLVKHARLDLNLQVNGDLHVDEHHSIEDAALVLGEAFHKALGDKRGIQRYGHFSLPMDEALAEVAIDFSGRPWLVWEADFRREKVGGMPTEMFHHFFKSFSDTARCNLNIRVSGQNEHHMIEAIFKGWARAIRMAIAPDGTNELPSTKGSL
jgi:imidazoleglycerol-phosphate dehydratase/histidinol-phosphatase